MRAVGAGWFRRNPPLVRTDQVPDIVAGLIRGGDVPSWAEVHPEQEYPLETGKVRPPWGRVSVWLRRDGSMRGDAPPTARMEVCFGVRVEVAPDPERREGWDYMRVTADIHDRVFEVLNGERLGVSFREEMVGGVALVTKDVQAVWCMGLEPEAPRWDEALGVWEQTVEYKTVLERQPKETD